MPTIQGPSFGITEMPVGERAARYPDLELEKLVGAIETQGARFAWARATKCPCESVNDSTLQPDPMCPICSGSGILYFGPQDYEAPEAVGQLDGLQTRLVAQDGAAVIRGVLGRAVGKSDLFDVMGHLAWGTAVITVRPENKIGYQDRLISLDSEMVFFENVRVTVGDTTVRTRYLPTAVNQLRSLTTVYREEEHYRVENGIITWIESAIPEATETMSIHYNTRPVWRVVEHPHEIREISRRRPVPRTELVTPHGNPTPLPIQALVRLEHLPAIT